MSHLIKMLKINSSLSQQLNSIYSEIILKFKPISREFTQNCIEIKIKTNHVIELAPKYDYREIEANGFWTFAKLVVKFGAIVLESRDNDVSGHLLPVSHVLLCGLNLCMDFSKHDTLFGSSPEQFIELLSQFKSLTPQLDVVYGTFCSFWLCQSMRRVMTHFTTLMAVYSGNSFTNWWTSSRNLWNREQRAHTVAYIAQNATVEFVKSFWGLTENRFFRNHLLPKITNGLSVATDVNIRRQYKWIISSSEASVDKKSSKESLEVLADIRCRLLIGKIDKKELNLVLHIHGGGFVSQSPDAHEIYLRDWANTLNDSAILSVDYSLSPESKYPTALQEILDVYLWLKSGNKEVEEVLGFKPKKIVICGDSAGGNLSVALVLVLEQIKEIELPKAVLSFYAPLMLQTRGSASRLMTAVDTLLPLGVLLSCLEAYAPQNSEEISEDFVHISLEEMPTIDPINYQWSPNWSFKMKHSLNIFKEKIIGEERSPLRPWYREECLKKKLSQLNQSTNNEFISPLLSEGSVIPLYLIALTYDACLDDSISLAHKWKGAVTLDIIDELPHGFLNFIHLSLEAKRGSDLCLDRIRQSLH